MPNLAILKALGMTLEQWKELSDKEKREATAEGNKRIEASHPRVTISYSQSDSPEPSSRRRG